MRLWFWFFIVALCVTVLGCDRPGVWYEGTRTVDRQGNQVGYRWVIRTCTVTDTLPDTLRIPVPKQGGGIR